MNSEHRIVSLARTFPVCAAVVGLVGIAGLTGCRTGESGLVNKGLADRNQALLTQLEECRASQGILQSGIDERDATIARMQGVVTGLEGDQARLQGDLLAFDEQLRNMKFSQLDPRTDRELRRFANANPDIVDYDADFGMLRFKSDLTFQLGKDIVSDTAKQSLRALAGLLNGVNAGRYDVRVVGHTDDVPIKHGRAQHPTNMHLSCHRAIAVRTELVSLGVAPARIEAAGRGEFQPLVPNSSDKKRGTAQNRRVEVFLVRSMADRIAAADAVPAAPVAPVNAMPDDMTK